MSKLQLPFLVLTLLMAGVVLLPGQAFSQADFGQQGPPPTTTMQTPPIETSSLDAPPETMVDAPSIETLSADMSQEGTEQEGTEQEGTGQEGRAQTETSVAGAQQAASAQTEIPAAETRSAGASQTASTQAEQGQNTPAMQQASGALPTALPVEATQQAAANMELASASPSSSSALPSLPPSMSTMQSQSASALPQASTSTMTSSGPEPEVFNEPKKNKTKDISSHVLTFEVVQDEFVLDTDTIKNARIIDSENGIYQGLNIELKTPAAKIFTDITKAGLGRRLKLIFNNVVITTTVLQTPLTGNFLISGISRQDAQAFLNVLNANKQPANLQF
jgi:preprotein translocase subunit SecD